MSTDHLRSNITRSLLLVAMLSASPLFSQTPQPAPDSAVLAAAAAVVVCAASGVYAYVKRQLE